MKHIMLDLETLSSANNAAIVSIGGFAVGVIVTLLSAK
jgi:hypothetical protein